MVRSTKNVLRILLVALLASTFISPGAVQAGDVNATRIDELVSLYHEYGLFDGTVLVAENGRVILEKGYGYANREWRTQHEPDTRFRIASITKPFTAMLVMQLVAKGKIDLSNTVTELLPFYREDTGDRVTVHDLLCHSSGIPDYLRIPGFWQNQLLLNHLRKEFVKQYCSGDLEFEPGTQYKYSNSGYYLLGMIIEEIEDRSFGDILDEYILKPLGMDDTGLDGGSRIIDKRAAGYAKVGFEHVNVPYLNIENIFAAGQMYSTAEDLFAWDQALYTDQLLSRELREKLFAPYHSHGDGRYSVGYGWEIGKYTISQEFEEIGYVRHFGGLNGFNTLLCRLVKDRHTIILLGNLDRALLEEISIKITSILYGQPYTPPLKSIALELYQIMGKAGAEAGIERYRSLMDSQPDGYDFGERELNTLGYYLLGQEKFAEAVAVFKLNVEIYPEYANGWDSLGEACVANGDNDEAIKYYEKSLELDPGNKNAANMLEKLRGLE